MALGIKHGNCCGVEVDDYPLRAMIEGDPRALFGGTVLILAWKNLGMEIVFLIVGRYDDERFHGYIGNR